MKQKGELEEDFVLFKEAKTLKKLGFDMQCFGVYENNKLGNPKVSLHISYTDNPVIPEEHKDRPAMFKVDNRNSSNPQWVISAPTYQQAFKWFRKEHNLGGYPTHQSYEVYNNEECIVEIYPLENFEEAELDCLRKLIEIVKKKK